MNIIKAVKGMKPETKNELVVLAFVAIVWVLCIGTMS